MIRIILFLANVLLPVTIILFALTFTGIKYRWFFMIFMLGHCFFRVWETFYTSKERDARKFEGDWTLALGTMAYIGLCFLVTCEFFLLPHSRHLGLAIMGLGIYIVAARLRLWGQTTLGRQWAVHVVGQDKMSKKRLLKIGPYKYVRHPIYLGILMEEFALPILFNTFFSLVLVVAVNAPLLLIRLLLEERKSQKGFSEGAYESYKRETGLFWPRSFRNCFNFFKGVFLFAKSKEA